MNVVGYVPFICTWKLGVMCNKQQNCQDLVFSS